MPVLFGGARLLQSPPYRHNYFPISTSMNVLFTGLGRGVGLVTKIVAGLVAWVLLAIAAFP